MAIGSNREDSVLVYRFIRDHGPVTVLGIAEGCFPLTFGSADPLYARLIKRSVSRALAAVEWLRSEGSVDVTCLSRPGSSSLFVLGVVAQGREAFSVLGRAVVVTEEVSQVGDLMAVWHDQE